MELKGGEAPLFLPGNTPKGPLKLLWELRNQKKDPPCLSVIFEDKYPLAENRISHFIAELQKLEKDSQIVDLQKPLPFFSPFVEEVEKNVEIKNRKPEDFSKELLETLGDIAVKYKMDWKKISKHLKRLTKLEFTPTLLREVYIQNNPKDKIKRFTRTEDNKILREVRKNGKDWSLIAKEFEERGPLTLRNRYYYLKKEQTKKKPRKFPKKKA